MAPLRDAYYLPTPPDAVELRAFTHGLMPRTVPTMMERFLEDWRARGVDAWNEVPNHWQPGSGERVGWWTLPDYLGDRFVAPFLGAPEGTCILQPNAHWTVQCLLTAPEPFAGGRRRVILTEGEFPSVLHSVRRWAPLLDLDVVCLPPGPEGWVDEAAVLEAIDARTALVLLSHVGFTTGAVLPDATLRRTADAVHEAGGLLAVDGYHAVGTATTPVPELDIDVYFGGFLKEGSGAAGSAFVYLRPGLELTPRVTGWFGDAAPFAFEQAPRPHPMPRRRFLGGTTAVAPLYHAVEGLRLLLAAGLDAVRARSLAQTGAAIARLDAAGLPLRSPRDPERRSAMLIVEVPDAGRLCASLKAHHIYTDSRQNRYLRFAPFVWNTDDELDRALDRLIEAVHTGAYRHAPYEAPLGPVT